MRWDAIEPGNMQGVYAIFVKGTENCLYVGQSSNLRSRINGHYNNSKSSDLRSHVQRDNDSPVEARELQFLTEVRIMQMPGSEKSHRITIEKKLTNKLEPIYPR
ncbi:GIY-YIG nuclease family protein [Halogranum rubrum]|uniref:GIY-YIG nuclease family protein n=1 Tax=Halogranum rubrum TaxID=553466 RepID=UPI000B7F95DE